MDDRNEVDGDNTGFVPLFTRTPQLCAGALAALGSALWLNVVGPFAGLAAAWGALVFVNALAVAVVAVLAVLVTTSATLLAADWRADAASRQAWAEIDVAAAPEFRLPAGRVAPSHIDPRYLTATDGEPLRSVFDAPHFTSQAPELQAASRSARAVAASGGSIPRVKLQGAPTSSRKTSTVAGSDADLADVTCQRVAVASLGREPLIVASCRALKQVSHAQRAVSAPRLAANGDAWPQLLARDRPSDGSIADIIVLSGDRGDRDRRERVPDPYSGGSIVGSLERPNCRGPPLVVGQGSGVRETPPAKPSVDGASPGHTASTRPTSDPLVVDDLGHRVPICAAELDVIETYLGRALQDLLGPGASVADREKS
jgi:hypothetical protein